MMQQLGRILLVLLLPAAVLGCAREQAIDTVAGREEQAFARAAIDDLRRGDIAALAARSPASQLPASPEAIRSMRAVIPADAEPIPIGASTLVTDGRRTTRLVYAVDGSGQHAAINVDVTRTGSALQLAGMAVRPLPAPLSETQRFPLSQLGIGDILFLLLGLAAVATTIAAIVRVWRSGRFGHRWLWTIGCMIGIIAVRKAVPGGELTLFPFYLQFFGFGVVKTGPFAPWFATVAVPVVALIVLFTRRAKHPATDEVVA